MFFEALYFGDFPSFYTMQLEPPKPSSDLLCRYSTNYDAATQIQLDGKLDPPNLTSCLGLDH